MAGDAEAAAVSIGTTSYLLVNMVQLVLLVEFSSSSGAPKPLTVFSA